MGSRGASSVFGSLYLTKYHLTGKVGIAGLGGGKNQWIFKIDIELL